ncbi:MAG: hypothetical protein FWF50_02415 [Defluviitaleaceae bacterium]|nr:hypothetical protein [Defluviitaleaceae bacterium]
MQNDNWYQLMYKNEVILEFSYYSLGNNKIKNENLLPLGIKNGMALENWLRQRRADSSRTSIRKLFSILKINFGNDKYISQFRKPTDFYWIRKKDSNELFEDTIENYYPISLNLSPINTKNPRNFETSNIGSYEKGWKDGFLLKVGNKNEIFSELLYSEVSKKYIETASYFIEKINDKIFIASPNFISLTNNEFLVLADEWTHTGAEEDFEDFFIKFKNQLSKNELEGLKFIHFLDIVMNNFDRHCQNFGFIYDENGNRRLAPNFDFNLSIIGYNGLENLGENELPLSIYFNLFENIPNELKNIPPIDELKKLISSICKNLNLDEEKYMKISDWIILRWEKLLKMEKN